MLNPRKPYQRTFVTLSKDTLQWYFEYKDGGLYHKQERRGAIKGKRFGAVTPGGRLGSFFSESYLEHQLIWVYFNDLPMPKRIYHRNKNVYDNRIENLYVKEEDLNYTGVPKRGGEPPLGIKGVYLIGQYKDGRPRFQVLVRWCGKSRSLYCGDDFFEACCCIKRHENTIA